MLILGRIGHVFRQLKRTLPVETHSVKTPWGLLVVPTLDELLCMKAFLAYDRGATRDFWDFAALSERLSEKDVLDSLLKLDVRYGELQSASVPLEVAKALTAAAPFDLNETELPAYKGLVRSWHKLASDPKYLQPLWRFAGQNTHRVIMQHRHLDTDKWSAAAIDSVLERGDLGDWRDLFAAARNDRELAELILRVASEHDLGGASALAKGLLKRLTD